MPGQQQQPPPGPLCTRASIADDLRCLGLQAGDIVLMHSSLSSLGWVSGGAEAVVQALMDVLSTEGTLVVPSHTGDNSDPAEWMNPPVPPAWWETIRHSWPAYNAQTTPSSRHMGRIAEAVRTWPGARRSAHPRTSFAAVGSAAGFVTEGHTVDCMLGEASPLARLEEAADARAKVLLLGVGFDVCTAFHLAEYRLPGGPPMADTSFAMMSEGGDGGRQKQRRWVTVCDVDVSDDGFAALGEAFRRERTDCVRIGRIGAAKTTLFPVAEAVAFAQERLLACRHALNVGV